jgi:hypothetical protein
MISLKPSLTPITNSNKELRDWLGYDFDPLAFSIAASTRCSYPLVVASKPPGIKLTCPRQRRLAENSPINRCSGGETHFGNDPHFGCPLFAE